MCVDYRFSLTFYHFYGNFKEALTFFEITMRQIKITPSITNRDSNSFEKYLQEISKEEMIDLEEEVALAKRIKAGDSLALEKLVKANLRFVVSVAKQYQNRGLSLSDLINEGNLGLIKAAQRFDETRGFKFISYAVWWIRQSILQAISEARLVRLPANRINSLNKVNRKWEELLMRFGREPTEEEIAESLETLLAEVRDALEFNSKPASLNADLGEPDDSGTLIDLLPNEGVFATDQKLNEESLKADIKRALASLKAQERDILCLYFGLNQEPLTLEEIGLKFNLTRERIRQIKEKALRKLKAKKFRFLKYHL